MQTHPSLLRISAVSLITATIRNCYSTRSRRTKEILDEKKAPAEDTADADVLKEIIEKF